MSGTDHFITLEGHRFHYVRWSVPGAPVLVALHGLRSYGRTFEPLAEALAGRFDVVALDQRGRGLTDWDPQGNYYTDRYVADLAAFVDALGLDRFHLLGHSMGGTNTLVYAAGNADRLASVVLEDAGPGASTNSERGKAINAELMRTPMRFDNRDAARAFWRSIRPHVTEEAIDSRVRHSLEEGEGGFVWRHDQAGIAAARLDPAPGRGVPDLWPGVKAIRCPGLLVRGGDSDYLSPATAAAMVAANANLQRVDIPGAGHYVHDDQPAAFLAAVVPFLAEQAR